MKKKRKKNKPTKHQMTTMLLRVPLNVKCQFKAHCSRRGRTMTEVVIEAMRLAYRVDKRIRRKKGKD